MFSIQSLSVQNWDDTLLMPPALILNICNPINGGLFSQTYLQYFFLVTSLNIKGKESSLKVFQGSNPFSK